MTHNITHARMLCVPIFGSGDSEKGRESIFIEKLPCTQTLKLSSSTISVKLSNKSMKQTLFISVLWNKGSTNKHFTQYHRQANNCANIGIHTQIPNSILHFTRFLHGGQRCKISLQTDLAKNKNIRYEIIHQVLTSPKM